MFSRADTLAAFDPELAKAIAAEDLSLIHI